jgi:cysteine desulfurase
MDVVYLDHNATTPLDPAVAEVMTRVALDYPGNPDSAHRLGRAARARLEDAREKVATLIGASPKEIVFTSGGTEADNLAIFGALAGGGFTGGRFLTTTVEHPAVLRMAAHLEERGFRVTRLPVDEAGRTSVETFTGALDDDVVLASIMFANNETGAIFPIREMAAAARERGVLLHTDAVQAFGKIPVRVDDLGVDLLAGAAHKFNGPRGVGFLYVRHGVPMAPMLRGGPHERGLRPGTSPVALAAGLAHALAIAVRDLTERSERMRELADRLLSGIREGVNGVLLNGPEGDRLPNTVNVSIPGAGGEALLIALDRDGFCIATGSACATGSALPSHVLTAMGRTPDEIASSIRLSLGRTTTRDEVDHFLEVLPGVVSRLRSISASAG